MKEVWKDVVGYEGIYEVSNLGQIRTCADKVTYTKRHGTRHWKQRILKQKGNYKLGKRVTLWKDGKAKYFLVHRLEAIAFLGNPPNEKSTVNHIDGNRFNNSITNLEWISREENIKHGFRNGLYPTRKITILTPQGETKEFFSLCECSRFLGKNNGYTTNCLKNKRKILQDKEGKEYRVIEVTEKKKTLDFNIYNKEQQ